MDRFIRVYPASNFSRDTKGSGTGPKRDSVLLQHHCDGAGYYRKLPPKSNTTTREPPDDAGTQKNLVVWTWFSPIHAMYAYAQQTRQLVCVRFLRQSFCGVARAGFFLLSCNLLYAFLGCSLEQLLKRSIIAKKSQVLCCFSYLQRLCWVQSKTFNARDHTICFAMRNLVIRALAVCFQHVWVKGSLFLHPAAILCIFAFSFMCSFTKSVLTAQPNMDGTKVLVCSIRFSF